MTDDHVLKLWADAWDPDDHPTDSAMALPSARVLRFAALIREECIRDRPVGLPMEPDEKDAMIEALREQVASLEGDVDEAEQQVVDLRAIEAGLRNRLSNLTVGKTASGSVYARSGPA